MKHATQRRIDHAGDNHAHTFTRAELAEVSEHLLDAARELFRQHVDLFAGLKTVDDAQLLAHQIGEQDVSARSTNVDADDASLTRVNVQERGPASASYGFADSAFEDQRFAEKFAHE